MKLILTTALGIVFALFQSMGYNSQVPNLDIPRDIRTIYSQGPQPKIIRTVCCPTCYAQYPSDAVPTICKWQKSKRAKKCNTELWKDRKTPSGIKRVPRAHYSTQSFDSWLEFFLSRPHIEDHLHRTSQRYQEFQGVPEDPMHDVHQSPAWRSLGNFLLYPYHLVWAIYIDWFNPFTNKISGMFL